MLRVAVTLDGETITGLKPVMGYLHRNHDKIGERNTYLQNIPYTDRLDYFNSMSNNFGYVTTVEKLMNIPVAERAEYIRVICSELNRISSHLVWWGAFLLDLGGFTPLLYAFDDREKILDLLARMLLGAAHQHRAREPAFGIAAEERLLVAEVQVDRLPLGVVRVAHLIRFPLAVAVAAALRSRNCAPWAIPTPSTSAR